MEKNDFDIIVIGSGPGGYIAATRAAEMGMKVACVEKMATLGGTCLNIGCIPSKALLQTTEYYDWMQKSSKEHGIAFADASLDFMTMMKRKESIVKGLVDGVASLFKGSKITRLEGTAGFADDHTIEVSGDSGSKRYSASYFIIATGSYPSVLPFLPFDEKTIVSSTGALSLSAPPKKLLVIGAGAIGVELASVYRRLGSEVTIVEMLERITPAMDEAISKGLHAILKKQGMEFFLGAKVLEAKTGDKNVELSVEYEQKKMSLKGDIVLVAVGRKPFTNGLGLDKVGINLDSKGFIPVDGNFRTSQKHIFAIGDVIEGPMLAHKASHEGIAAVEIIKGLRPQVNYLAIPNVIYTNPEAASVGLTEVEAKAAGLDIKVGISYFKANGRARCFGETDGFVKVIGEAQTGILLGMHILGLQASELIAEGMLAIAKRATLHDLANACHAHPTLSETIMEACQKSLS